MLAGLHNAVNPFAVIAGAPIALGDEIELHRKLIRAGQYHLLGVIDDLIFELDRDGLYDAREAKVVGRRICWASDRNHPGRLLGPRLAFSSSEKALLVLPPVGLLPKVSDPYYKRKPGEMGDPRMIEQRWHERASGVWKNFVVIQPLAEIKFRPYGQGAKFGVFRPLTGNDGRKAAWLIDPFKQEAFIVGGRYEMVFKG